MEEEKSPVDKEKFRSLHYHIESLTHSGSKYLNKEELIKVFDLCGGDPQNIVEAHKTVFKHLEKKHAEVRFSSAQLCHELFMKFDDFRKLVINDSIYIFFQLTMGIKDSEPLPPPISTAKQMSKMVMEFFLDWHMQFSHEYNLLKLALKYLDEVEHVDFRTLEIVDPKKRKERDEQEKALRKINKARLNNTNKEMEDLIPEIRCTLTSLNTCFELLLPSPDDDGAPRGEESNFEEDMRLFGVVNPKHSVPIEIELSDKVPVKVDDENCSIIDALKDAFKLINNRFLPKTKAWVEIINKGKGEKECMNRALTLQKELETAITKYHRLHIIAKRQEDDSEEDGDDVSTDSDMEEVEEPKPPKRLYVEDEVSLFSTSASKNKKEEISKSNEQHQAADVKVEAGPSGLQKTNERKKKLLEVAPKLPYDVDLYHWEDEKLSAPTMIATNTEGARFWSGGGDELVELPVPDGVSSLRTRVIEFTGEWEPVGHSCKAPLPSGKLCPRQDRVRCPFHGLIVDRDDKGNIVNKEDEERVAKSKTKPDVPEWQDPKLLAELKAQTGLDLKMPEKGKRKKKKKKHPGLTDLKEVNNTPKNRLAKKIFNKKAVKRVAATLDKIEHNKHRDKFGDQFNYVHGT